MKHKHQTQPYHKKTDINRIAKQSPDLLAHYYAGELYQPLPELLLSVMSLWTCMLLEEGT